jgi:hypothetical protein
MTEDERRILNRAINRMVSDAIRLNNTAALCGSPRQRAAAAEMHTIILRSAGLFVYAVPEYDRTGKRKLTPRNPDFKLRE